MIFKAKPKKPSKILSPYYDQKYILKIKLYQKIPYLILKILKIEKRLDDLIQAFFYKSIYPASLFNLNTICMHGTVNGP
jgi:hypothetical protein